MEQEQLGNDVPQTDTGEPAASFEGESVEKDYRAVKTLKSSASGETLLVAAKDTGNLFVLKHIYGTGLAYDKLRTLVDPALPQILYVNENKSFGVTTVIEEYLPGLTLDQWMEQRELEPISDQLAKLIFGQLAGGLKTLHENQIMHRAVSPKNIMMMGGNVKFIGFDHAVVGKSYEDAPVYRGMTGFAPPEQAVMGKADLRSDVYSLGMTMKNLLGADYKGKYGKVLGHCISSDPEERYQNGAQLKKALKSAGIISLSKVALICAALYVLVFGGLWAANRWYNPMKDIQARQTFEREQKAARAEAAAAEMEKGLGTDSSDTAGDGASYNDGSGLAKGKLGLTLTFPDHPQEENAGGIVVNMGKASELTSAGNSKGQSTVFFPGKSKLVLSIKNNTDSDIKNPVIKFVPYYIDLSHISDPPNTITKHSAGAVECRRDISIPAGGEMKFELPLDKATILYPSGQNASLKVVLSSDNYADTSAQIKFSFD